MQLSDDDLLAAAAEKRDMRYRQADTDFQREVEAIKLVKMLREQREKALEKQTPAAIEEPATQPELIPPPAPMRVYLREDWPGLTRAVRRAVDAQVDVFGLDDVKGWIAARFPTQPLDRTQLSRELWRLKSNEKITTVSDGAGRRPAIYKKANHQSLAEAN